MNFWIGLAYFLITVLLKAFMVQCITYSSAPHNNFQKKYTNVISKNELLGTHRTTLRNCARLCARKPECVGYNIGPLNLGPNMVISCNLTKYTTFGIFDAQSASRAGYGYYEKMKCDMILDESLPCPKGYNCCPEWKNQRCPPYKRGENCSKTCTSYILYKQDIDYSNDKGTISDINNELPCWKACWNNLKCLAFTYVGNNRACYLKYINDKTDGNLVTSIMPIPSNLCVLDCRPYDIKVPS